MGYLMAAPWLLGILWLYFSPFGTALYLSLTDYDILTASNWVGFENFDTMLTDDPLFWKSLSVTTIYSVASIPLQIVLGLFLAILLNTKIQGAGLVQDPLLPSGRPVRRGRFVPLDLGVLRRLGRVELPVVPSSTSRVPTG